MALPPLLVTASDREYFPLAHSCLLSIRKNAPSVKVAFLDLGCTPPQLDWLAQHVDFIRQPDWEFDFPGRETKPQFLRGLLARPFLRSYFPGFEVYLWIDADAWVQRFEAIDLLVRGCTRRSGLAIVPEIDRCSMRQYGAMPAYWAQAFQWYKNAFDDVIANKLCNFPMLNAGVYAMHREAPHWDIWRQCIAHALPKYCTTMTDQIALNYAVYQCGLFRQTELLPMWCNWTCHNGFPKWDDSANCFVERFLPFHEVGILHLTTRDKSTPRMIETLSGTKREMQVVFVPETDSVK
ncbi:MAG: hypothetical protein ABL921_21615 [Pirellula sp.]